MDNFAENSPMEKHPSSHCCLNHNFRVLTCWETTRTAQERALFVLQARHSENLIVDLDSNLDEHGYLSIWTAWISWKQKAWTHFYHFSTAGKLVYPSFLLLWQFVGLGCGVKGKLTISINTPNMGLSQTLKAGMYTVTYIYSICSCHCTVEPCYELRLSMRHKTEFPRTEHNRHWVTSGWENKGWVFSFLSIS